MKATIAAVLAAVLLLACAAFLFVDYSYPATSSRCAIAYDKHRDENAAAQDRYYITLVLEDDTIQTVEVTAETVYTIETPSRVLLIEQRGQLSGNHIAYDVVYDYQEACRKSPAPEGLLGGGYALSVDQ